ncbi:MAG: deoxyribodipyrimidine photo-lyase [Candidatus Babeliaceae bacterium]|nr:deoxyribodipyrimidine photo-lyase [Candidatus Babeliaceae bacterium]
MKKRFKLSLFLFRRDFRVVDNKGLAEALKQSQKVIPLVIIDPREEKVGHCYGNDRLRQFRAESLFDLLQALSKKGGELFVATGRLDTLLIRLLHVLPVEALFFVADYNPDGILAGREIARVCVKTGIVFQVIHDRLLIGDPAKLLNKSEKPFQMFSPFLRVAEKQGYRSMVRISRGSWWRGSFPVPVVDVMEFSGAEKGGVKGGRAAGLRILRRIRRWCDYAKTRDIPSLPTTRLAAYLHQGCLSVREVADTIKKSLGLRHELIRQLYWRDFFTYLCFWFPRMFERPCRRKYESIRWRRDRTVFRRWCIGETTEQFVNAGMHELVSTGFMHNRLRMIVASYLTKDLHIDWRWGERFFARYLIDYDPAVNNGNWQWVASVGCSAMPPFRKFSPETQQKKFDSQRHYTKQWI